MDGVSRLGGHPGRGGGRSEVGASVIRSRISLKKETRTQSEIDACNLRLYARLFRKYHWQTDVLHWSVFAATCESIADRLAPASVVETPGESVVGLKGESLEMAMMDSPVIPIRFWLMFGSRRRFTFIRAEPPCNKGEICFWRFVIGWQQ